MAGLAGGCPGRITGGPRRRRGMRRADGGQPARERYNLGKSNSDRFRSGQSRLGHSHCRSLPDQGRRGAGGKTGADRTGFDGQDSILQHVIERVSMTNTQAAGPSRQRLLDALNRRQPDRIPVDFGGSGVTGIHVSCVAELRNYYGLEKHPVKVIHPFTMLGEVEDDLMAALGVDVKTVIGRRTPFGFENRDWKPWLFNGLKSWCREPST